MKTSATMPLKATSLNEPLPISCFEFVMTRYYLYICRVSSKISLSNAGWRLHMKKTPATDAVLGALMNSGSPLWGLAICKLVDLLPGTVYPILRRLEAASWLTSSWGNSDEAFGGPRRRYYSLTDFGRQAAGEYLNRERRKAYPRQGIQHVV
jgi:DNA-binding MarR family transcriptional regulator